MTKENFLFTLVGLLAGCIIGFMVANSINQSAVKNVPVSPSAQVGPVDPNAPIPPGHPDVSNGNTGATQAQIDAAVEKAKAEPDNFEAQMSAAETFYRAQKFDESITYLKAANKIKPDDYETIVNLGNLNFDTNNFPEAEKWYRSALEKKTDDVNVRTDLGLSFMLREKPDYDRAIEEFNRALEVDPNHIQALQNLTVALTRKGDSAQAGAAVARLETIDPKNATLAKLRDDIQKIGTSR